MALHPEDGGDPDGRRVLAHVAGNLGESQITTSLEISLDEVYQRVTLPTPGQVTRYGLRHGR
jgi:hypothetical protein